MDGRLLQYTFDVVHHKKQQHNVYLIWWESLRSILFMEFINKPTKLSIL